MAEKVTEIWQRIYDQMPYEGLIKRIHEIQEHTSYFQIDRNLQNSFLALSKRFSDKNLASWSAPVELVTSTLQKGFLYSTRLQEYSLSICALAGKLKESTELNWNPSDVLTDSVNTTLQEASAFQKNAQAGISLDLPIDQPLTKEYIKSNLGIILECLGLLLTILFFFWPNPNEQVIIEQNQQIIKQNNEQLQLDKERNQLLQSIFDTLQTVDDETGIFREQSDAFVEQDSNLSQTPDSPGSDNATNSQQQ